MNLLDALWRFADRPFPWALRNVAALLFFLTLVVLFPNRVAALASVLGLVVVLAFLNRRAFMQLVYEGHGANAFKQGRYPDADAYFRKSWHLAQTFSANDRARGRVLEWLTRTARLQGNYDDAESFCKQWLDADQNALGENHLRTILATEELAMIYVNIARYHQALPLWEKALRMRESRQVRDPVGYAYCLRSLGALWCRLERYDKAEPYVRKAFDLMRRHPEPTGAIELVPGQTLCVVCMNRNELEEAESLAESALAQAESKSPPDRLQLSGALRLVAEVRRYQERWDEAETLVRRAIEINHSVGSHEALHLLGNVLRHQSRWAEAEEFFQETLRLRDEYLAPEDLAIARVLEDYAELLELMNRMEEAHQHDNRAKQIRDFHSPFRIV